MCLCQFELCYILFAAGVFHKVLFLVLMFTDHTKTRFEIVEMCLGKAYIAVYLGRLHFVTVSDEQSTQNI